MSLDRDFIDRMKVARGVLLWLWDDQWAWSVALAHCFVTIEGLVWDQIDCMQTWCYYWSACSLLMPLIDELDECPEKSGLGPMELTICRA